MTLSRNPELWQSLPAEKQNELENSSEFIAIEKELETLTLRSKDDSETKDRRKELLTQKRKLVSDELRVFQKLQPRKHPSKAGEYGVGGHHRTLFQRFRGLMPERDRLASSLFTVAPIRSDEGRAVLHNMINLYQQDRSSLLLSSSLSPLAFLFWPFGRRPALPRLVVTCFRILSWSQRQTLSSDDFAVSEALSLAEQLSSS
jgi:hypothetical protein